MTSLDNKIFILNELSNAVKAGCRLEVACRDINISIRTIQRWKKRQKLDDLRTIVKKKPKNKLSEEEINEIIKVINSKKYRDLTPYEIVPLLTDEGRYLASVATFYRIMKKLGMSVSRNRSKAKLNKKPKGYIVYGPNQVWSWDITYLRSNIMGKFYYLYMIMDIYSRKIVGWRVHETEESKYSSQLISESCAIEGIDKSDSLVLHSDNGGPMKGATMLATMQKLGVISSFSRPRVSNDNPYSESTFKTMKYCPYYPKKPFKSLEEAENWVSYFVNWYNKERLHGEINYVTPESRHNGTDKAILKARRDVYIKARQAHPERWSKNTKQWTYEETVFLNVPTEIKDKLLQAKTEESVAA